MDTPQQYPTMWTTGYIGSVKVSFTFPIRNEMDAYAQAKAITDKLVADGFTTHEPGLEAGEFKEQVGYVSRRQKKNDDNTITPIIDVYSPHDAMKFKFISVYLNTSEDVTAFEKASGLTLSRLPLVPGKAALDKSDDSGGVVLVGREMFIVMKPNPYFDPDEKEISKMKPKNNFIRWESPAPATPPPSQPATTQASEPPRVAFTEPSISNELITIVQVVKGDSVQAANDNYRGYTYHATAKFTDPDNVTSTFLLKLWPEDVNAIKKAGYPFPDAGGDCKIPVVAVVLADGTLRINRDALTSAAAGVVPEGQYKPDWTIIYSKVKALYDNQKHMGNSVQALFKEGAFKGCRSDADAIAVIVAHKNGFAEGTPA